MSALQREVGVIQGDLKISKKCYVESLKLKRIWNIGINTIKVYSGMALMVIRFIDIYLFVLQLLICLVTI